MPYTPAARKWRAIATFALVLFAVATLVMLLLWRAHRNDLNAKRLCQVLSQLIREQDGRLDGLDYYRHHPLELRQAHAANQEVLARLACSDPVPVKEKP